MQVLDLEDSKLLVEIKGEKADPAPCSHASVTHVYALRNLGA